MVVEVVVAATVSAGLYVLTLSAFPKDDLSLGMGCGLVVGVVAAAGRHAVRGSWSPRPGWLRWLGPIGVGVLVDTAAVYLAAARRLGGRRSPGRKTEWKIPTERRAPQRRARAAVSTIAIASTPSTMIVDADDSAGVFLVHALGNGQQLVRRAVTSDRR